jgi:hypothetical protein
MTVILFLHIVMHHIAAQTTRIKPFHSSKEHHIQNTKHSLQRESFIKATSRALFSMFLKKKSKS